ncbi:ABC transporter ATP-binding protein [Paenibacillus sp. JCM 10914]
MELKRVLSFLKGNRRGFLIGMIGESGLKISLVFAQAYVFKFIVEAAVEKDTTFINQAILLICTVVLLVIVSTPFFKYMGVAGIKKTIAGLKTTLFGRIIRLPIAFSEKTHSSNLLSRLTNDVQSIERIYQEFIYSLFYSGLSSSVFVAFMLAIEWKLSVILLSFTLVSVGLNIYISRSIRSHSDSLIKQLAIWAGKFTDMLNGFKEIKMFRSDRLDNVYEQTADNVRKSSLTLGYREASLESINYFISLSNFMGTFVIGAILVVEGSVGLGTLMALVQIQSSLTFTVLEFGRRIPELQVSLSGARRVTDLLDEEMEPRSWPMEGAMSRESAFIELNNVVFSYEAGKPVIDNVSLTVGKNEMVAIVGSSGCGKSTLLKLLLGFYPVDHGSVHINGKPITDFSLTELRAMMSFVSQDCYLFNGTIEENIKHARPSATRDEIIEACKTANALEFIEGLPDGFQTRLEANGQNLSGGQKQRIAIARAVLKNAPILLLDEATSSLDTESEALIHSALEELMKDRTTIKVAHRLFTVIDADQIHLMDKGRIVESGTHEDLIKRNGAYRRLIQFNEDGI